jgi:hypothetical protein
MSPEEPKRCAREKEEILLFLRGNSEAEIVPQRAAIAQ